MKENIREFAVAVRSPKDVDSAREAAVRLRASGVKMREIAERLAKLEFPAKEVGERLGRELRDFDRKLEEEMGDGEAAWENLDGAATKIFEEAMAEWAKSMQESMVVVMEYFPAPKEE